MEAVKANDVELKNAINVELEGVATETIQENSCNYETKFVDNTQYAPILERIENVETYCSCKILGLT